MGADDGDRELCSNEPCTEIFTHFICMFSLMA